MRVRKLAKKQTKLEDKVSLQPDRKISIEYFHKDTKTPTSFDYTPSHGMNMERCFGGDSERASGDNAHHSNDEDLI